jgi:hypothetical protein
MRERLLRWYDLALTFVAWALFVFVLSLLLVRSVYVPVGLSDRVRNHILGVEFDFVGWTVDAIGGKLRHASVAEQRYLDEAARSSVVRRLFELRREQEQVERDIRLRYADPAISDPAAATVDLSRRQAELRAEIGRIQPLAEAILQEQLSIILAEAGLSAGGQPFPPVAFHLTPLPYALIVSPRNVIRQDVNLDVQGELTLEEQVGLEEQIADDLDVSTLVVPLGGIGTYPTMVAQSSDLNWIASVVAHEWIHNYLTLRPLGLSYFGSDALRTMNETTAEMVGNELGARLMERYYPDLAPPPRGVDNWMPRDVAPRPPGEPPAFDFRAEMHTTRVTADALLAQGKIEEAEAYMEARRRFMWDHGYQIRKLNQAYFAFYGAYAAGGGGAAGADPVGTAVRLLRRRSPDLASFVNTMAWFTSFEQLEGYLGMPATTR